MLWWNKATLIVLFHHSNITIEWWNKTRLQTPRRLRQNDTTAHQYARAYFHAPSRKNCPQTHLGGVFADTRRTIHSKHE